MDAHDYRAGMLAVFTLLSRFTLNDLITIAVGLLTIVYLCQRIYINNRVIKKKDGNDDEA
jgi:hypothetical protein